MPWAIAVGAGLGYLASRKSSKMQGKGLDQQADAMRDQTALGREQLDWSKEQYGKWEERFDPVFDSMMDELDADLEPNYAAIAGDVKSGFQSARGQERRNLQRYGVRPQDGAMARSEREYGIREAGAHVGARSAARESKRGLKYNRLASVAGMGYGVQPSVLGTVDRSAGDLNRSYGMQANQFGNIANMWGNQARDTAYGVSNFVSTADWGGMWNSVKGWFGGGSGDGTKPGQHGHGGYG